MKDQERIIHNLARRYASYLDDATGSISPAIQKRLTASRINAVASRKIAIRTTPFVLSFVSLGQADFIRSSIVALAALLLFAGIPLLHIQADQEAVEQRALIDQEILTDDLPVNAYLDSGFAVFLRSQ